ncbi:MAG: RnfABCDGE type electron transport complex subunit B [Ezakiella sp.]|nr:RnfABCDGE type electron transport complex subunit B [Ezakiella sp.]MDD7471640.1 RnfABCDGE type electron transport complex subunit B [Bacillota bacterium]MDY3923424.1 RnfABCDGE type electron transport complex subunit B [Ezakiella sp.]
MEILKPIIVLGSLGLLFGVLLSIASRVFAVEMNPMVGNILGVLPGANCGACGFPGCEGLANAIAKGTAPTNACPIGGAAVAQKVAAIVGGEAGEVLRQVAVVRCNGTCNLAKDKYEYYGIKDCRYISQIGGGNKACSYGCLGCGTCQEVCPFDAIEIKDGIAHIIKEKCKACNKCVVVCPKKIIELMPYDRHTVIKCASEDKGKVVKSNCAVGCIGCQICVKKCPKQTIKFENNLAHIDYTGCVDCKTCVKACPVKAIHDDRPEKPKKVLTPEEIEALKAKKAAAEAAKAAAQVTTAE